ncbi:MAG: hypothetical protein LC687_04755 [Actinobacteria bacterium]|nr:hypothetical protein [Actinomycetota bacterium]MCA1807144.1 hypothetical protein [Actinomycetota bacterium]
MDFRNEYDEFANGMVGTVRALAMFYHAGQTDERGRPLYDYIQDIVDNVTLIETPGAFLYKPTLQAACYGHKLFTHTFLSEETFHTIMRSDGHHPVTRIAEEVQMLESIPMPRVSEPKLVDFYTAHLVEVMSNVSQDAFTIQLALLNYDIDTFPSLGDKPQVGRFKVASHMGRIYVDALHETAVKRFPDSVLTPSDPSVNVYANTKTKQLQYMEYLIDKIEVQKGYT